MAYMSHKCCIYATYMCLWHMFVRCTFYKVYMWHMFIRNIYVEYVYEIYMWHILYMLHIWKHIWKSVLCETYELPYIGLKCSIHKHMPHTYVSRMSHICRIYATYTAIYVNIYGMFFFPRVPSILFLFSGFLSVLLTWGSACGLQYIFHIALSQYSYLQKYRYKRPSIKITFLTVWTPSWFTSIVLCF